MSLDESVAYALGVTIDALIGSPRRRLTRVGWTDGRTDDARILRSSSLRPDS